MGLYYILEDIVENLQDTKKQWLISKDGINFSKLSIEEIYDRLLLLTLDELVIGFDMNKFFQELLMSKYKKGSFVSLKKDLRFFDLKLAWYVCNPTIKLNSINDLCNYLKESQMPKLYSLTLLKSQN